MKHRFAVVTALSVAAAGLALWLARPTPITAVDQEQPRLNQAAPRPHGATRVAQTLLAGHNGFSGIALLAVVGPTQPPDSVLTVAVMNTAGAILAQMDFAHLAHNAPIRLDFPPQAHSAGQTYTIQLSGTDDNVATAWAYGLDGYPAGTLTTNGHPESGDLQFSTTYTYLGSSALSGAVLSLWRLAVVAIPLWLLLYVPGALVHDVLRPAGGLTRVAGARWGLALGLSIALLALVWLWAGLVGWRWSPAGLWVMCGGLGLLLIGRTLLRWRQTGWPRPRLEVIGLAAIVLASVLVRLLAVRDLALPPWVDSSHHLLIARLLEMAGHIPASYRPVMPIDVFYYHFAFHALLVSLHWLTGMPLVDAALLMGQVLNGLVPLAVYVFTWGLTGRRRAALLSALVAGLVSYFPGYFVNWGRYSQLTGLLVLGPAAATLWRALRPGLAARRPSWRLLVLAAVLAAGVLLAHYRVLVFYMVFALAALLVHLRQRQSWRALAIAAIGGAALGLPWLGQMVVQALLPRAGNPQSLLSAAGSNAIPVDYFSGALERGWLVLALAAGLWGLRRRDRAIWAILAWIGLVFAGLNAGPDTWLVNNNAWAISLFLPAAALLGWGAESWWHRGRVLLAARAPGRWLWRPIVGVAVLAAGCGLAAYGVAAGARTQVAMLNPATVLATPADRQALEWLDANLPAEAVVAVNGWMWLQNIWAGSDGGAWITPLTGRQTTLPPNDYVYGSAAYKQSINRFNAQLAQATDANSDDFRALLHDAGVTHIFIGARGGTLKPEMFVGSPYYSQLYANGLAWIFSVNTP